MKNISIKSLIGLAYALGGYLIKQGYITPGSAAHYYGYAVAIAAFVSHLIHTPDADKPANVPIARVNPILSVFTLAAMLMAMLMTGCASSAKRDITEHPVRDRVVVTPQGDVIAPRDAFITITTNRPPWNLYGFLFGYRGHTYTFHTDEPKDKYTGSGKFLLADPAFAALDSHHTNQTVLGGNSSFSVGSASITVSTNGITAVGTAGSQVITSVGGLLGNAAGSAAKSAVGVPPVTP